MLLDTEKLVVLWEQRRGPVPFTKGIELDPRRALGPKKASGSSTFSEELVDLAKRVHWRVVGGNGTSQTTMSPCARLRNLG